RDLEVLEGLLLHDVAPVARGVADRQEDRAAQPLGGLEGLVAPRAPVHGVVGVLAQVGAGLEEQAVQEARRPVVREVARPRDVAGRTRPPGLLEGARELGREGRSAWGGARRRGVHVGSLGALWPEPG